MGRSRSIFTATGAGLRVSSQLTFTPAYIKPDGQFINQRVKIPVCKNSPKNKRTGVSNAEYFSLIVWGGLADLCCKNLTLGRAVDFKADPKSKPTKYYIGGNVLLGPDGQPIMIDKVTFQVDDVLNFAEETYELVHEEIRTGRRPQFWDAPNSNDQALWFNLCQQRNAIPYDGGPTYGYARVFNPAQGQVILNPVEYRKQLQTKMGGAQFTPGSFAPTPASLPSQVQAAFTQPVAAPVAAAVPPVAPHAMFGNGGFTQKAAAPTTAVAGSALGF